jgi:hypothetical protein
MVALSIVNCFGDGVTTVKQDVADFGDTLGQWRGALTGSDWYGNIRDFLASAREGMAEDTRSLMLLFENFRVEK